MVIVELSIKVYSTAGLHHCVYAPSINFIIIVHQLIECLPRITYYDDKIGTIMDFYPKVITFRSGLIALANPSVDRLHVVCNVCATYAYSGTEGFGNISSPLCTLAIL